MSIDEGIKRAWQSSGEAALLPPIEEVRRSAGAFYRLIRRRNAIEYAAAVLVVLVFTAYALLLPSHTARLGAAIVVAGTLVMAWQLRRRASALPPPEADGVRPVLVHQRAQLVRQRDALAGVLLWYLLPLMPGLAVMIFAPALDRGAGGLRAFGWGGWLSVATMIALFAFVWWLNRRAAIGLQKRIDELDAVLGEGR
jgi:hypothetical protein